VPIREQQAAFFKRQQRLVEPQRFVVFPSLFPKQGDPMRIPVALFLVAAVASTLATLSPAHAFPSVAAAGAPAAATPTVAGLMASLDGMTRGLSRATDSLGEAEVDLLDALGHAEQASELKAKVSALKAEPASPERDAKILEVYTDASISAAITAASTEQGELDDARRAKVVSADGKRFGAAVQITMVGVSAATAITQLVGIGQRVASGDASILADIAVVAASPKEWLADVKGRFQALGQSSKAFGESNKGVTEAMKAIYKAKKIEPPDYRAIEETQKASAF